MNNKLIIQLSHAVDIITKSSEKVFAKDIAGTRILPAFVLSWGEYWICGRMDINIWLDVGIDILVFPDV